LPPRGGIRVVGETFEGFAQADEMPAPMRDVTPRLGIGGRAAEESPNRRIASAPLRNLQSQQTPRILGGQIAVLVLSQCAVQFHAGRHRRAQVGGGAARVVRPAPSETAKCGLAALRRVRGIRLASEADGGGLREDETELRGGVAGLRMDGAVILVPLLVSGPAVAVVAATVIHDITGGFLHGQEIAVTPAHLGGNGGPAPFRVMQLGHPRQPDHPKDGSVHPFAEVTGIVPATGHVLMLAVVPAAAVIQMARGVVAGFARAATLLREVRNRLAQSVLICVRRDAERARASVAVRTWNVPGWFSALKSPT